MTETHEPGVQTLSVKGRYWRLRATDLNVGHENLEATIARALTGVDLISTRGELTVLKGLFDQIRARFPAWDARVGNDGEPFLIAGRGRTVERFFRDHEAGAAGSGAQDIVHGKYPQLPPLSEIPILPREGIVDPFGQNRDALLAAWRDSARAIGSIVSTSHESGLAFTLRPPIPGTINLRLKPWETVSTLDEESEAADAWMPVDHQQEGCTLESCSERTLDLMQRALLASAVCQASDEDEAPVQTIAESLGYVLASALLDPMEDDLVMLEHYIGDMLAVLHRGQIIHGDVHRENFALNKEQRRLLIVDSGSVCLLRRPLTRDEKLRDVAVFKPQCNAEQWEAVKLGYRNGPGAEDIFV